MCIANPPRREPSPSDSPILIPRDSTTRCSAIRAEPPVPFSRHPDQLALDLETPPTRGQPQRGFRSCELPVLLFLARHGVALSQQVVHRFATLDGKWPGHILTTIRGLVDDGTVQKHRLNPAAGRASREVLTLTSAGWAEVGRPPAPDPLAQSPEKLGFCLQSVEFHIAMEVRAWVRLTDPRAQWTAIKGWGMAHYRRKGRTELDEEHLRRISRMGPQTVPLQVWYHEKWGQVLFAAPSYHGLNLKRLLSAMPNLTLFPPVTIYVVGAFPSRVADDREVVLRWAKATRHRVEVRTITPFAGRPDPRRAGPPPSSQYVRYGAPSPTDSYAFEAGAIHARLGAYAVN